MATTSSGIKDKNPDPVKAVPEDSETAATDGTAFTGAEVSQSVLMPKYLVAEVSGNLTYTVLVETLNTAKSNAEVKTDSASSRPVMIRV